MTPIINMIAIMSRSSGISWYEGFDHFLFCVVSGALLRCERLGVKGSRMASHRVVSLNSLWKHLGPKFRSMRRFSVSIDGK